MFEINCPSAIIDFIAVLSFFCRAQASSESALNFFKHSDTIVGAALMANGCKLMATACGRCQVVAMRTLAFTLALAMTMVIGAAGCASQPASPSEPASYRITRTIPLGAPDRWDYVVYDAPSHRVYVSHADRLEVIDGRDGRTIGQVDGFAGGTHGVAVVAAAGLGYTDDGDAGEVGSFDLKTLHSVGQRIKAAEDADSMTFDPVSGHVFVVNGHGGTLTVIDPKTNSGLATIETGASLEYIVSGGNGKVYVNGEAAGDIVRVDVGTNRVDARWPMPGCVAPHGLAMDVANHRLFSSCANAVLEVVNADSGAVIATLPIGRGTDAAAFDPKRHLIFSSNGVDGTLSIIQERDANTFKSLGDIKTAPAGRTMGVDPDTGRLYVVGAEFAEPPPPTAPGEVASLRVKIVPGSLKLLFLDPVTH
jgi:YVTN family beta-propeller protein